MDVVLVIFHSAKQLQCQGQLEVCVLGWVGGGGGWGGGSWGGGELFDYLPPSTSLKKEQEKTTAAGV